MACPMCCDRAFVLEGVKIVSPKLVGLRLGGLGGLEKDAVESSSCCVLLKTDVIGSEVVEAARDV